MAEQAASFEIGEDESKRAQRNDLSPGIQVPWRLRRYCTAVMPTGEFEQILGRDRAKVNAHAFIEAACPLLRELVNYGATALARCSKAPDSDRRGGRDEDVAAIALYRHLLELVDGVEVLLSNGCSEASVPIVRSTFETSLSLRFILHDRDRYSQRSLAWVYQSALDQIGDAERYAPESERGRVFSDDFRRQFEDVQLSELATMSSDRITSLKCLLDLEHFQAVRSEYESLRKKKDRPNWYELFEGPRNVRELARTVGWGGVYALFYSDWSRAVHGLGASVHIQPGKSSGIAINALRTPLNFQFRAQLVAVLVLDATRMILDHFRPGERIGVWYEREVRSPFLALSNLRVTFQDVSE